MKPLYILSTVLLLGTTAKAQVTTAENGLSLSPDLMKVRLGGTLFQHTTIDLGSGNNLYFNRESGPVLSLLNNGYIGIGNFEPTARLSFPNAGNGDEATGMNWGSSGYMFDYGIHRTAGLWQYPNYQQLRLGWLTGIVLDPGTLYGKSYVDVQGNGLRVTTGNIGIGTTNAGTSALTIERNSSSGSANVPLITVKNTSTVLPAGNGYNLAGAEYYAGNEAVIGQCISNYGVGTNLPWSSGSGFYINTRTEHPIIFATGTASTEKARIGANGNFLIGTTTDNGYKLQVTGNTWTSGKLQIGTSSYNDQTPYTPEIWDTYNTRFNGGNVSIFAPGDQSITGNSYQLNFYARYHDGGRGDVTSKASYIKGTVTTYRESEPQPWQGRGTLVLGSTNTTYMPTAGFTDVPAMYLYDGKVGVGVAVPESQLHTTGTVRFAGLTNDNAKDRVVVSDVNGNLAYRDASTLGGGSSTNDWSVGGNSVTGVGSLGTTSPAALQIITNSQPQILIGTNGNVGIGTTSITDYKLSVLGNIRTRKVRVDADTWADYVFESDYKLRSLKEVEQYIQQNKHLPEVPTAAEVKKEGLDVGDNQALLFKKIEELTLYVIQQQKQLEAQQQKIETLEKKVNEKK